MSRGSSSRRWSDRLTLIVKEVVREPIREAAREAMVEEQRSMKSTNQRSEDEKSTNSMRRRMRRIVPLMGLLAIASYAARKWRSSASDDYASEPAPPVHQPAGTQSTAPGSTQETESEDTGSSSDEDPVETETE